ncbi:PEGA domain-containing protein [Myxococcaceae bacterium JPH2]|nr:PEGA domain-containing protein [Myxococcaceae bacterium JPH2]
MRFVLWMGVVAWTGCASSQPEPATMARARELMRTAGTPRGDLVLRCDPSDAEVSLDGVPQGMCRDFAGSPRGLGVGEGLHQIDVRKQGFWPYTTYYEASGARATLHIQLRASGTPSGGGTP